MTHKPWPPQDQVLWYLNREPALPCSQDMHADVVVIGGGMAGLAAAQAWSKRGKKVVLLEQYYCGAGASGKSSGFITPNAELSFTDFSKKYNFDVAHLIWSFISSGVEDIRTNIKEHNFSCLYSPQDTLVVTNSARNLKELETEHNNLSRYGYKTGIYDAHELKKNIGSSAYIGGFTYADTFHIKPYAYCQALAHVLRSQGVLIFEETPVIKVDNHRVITAHATITADYIVVCTDRFMPDLGFLKQEVYHAQTFVMASQQLTNEQVAAIFPKTRRLVWDTELIYNYFCITNEQRLLLGGGNVLSTYATKPYYNYERMFKKLTNYYARAFPHLDIQFEYMWPGLIGLSKDIMPLAGPDKERAHIFYVAASAGLPIATALGRYSAEYQIDDNRYLDAYFSPYRTFPISGFAQTLLGPKLSFALSNVLQRNIP